MGRDEDEDELVALRFDNTHFDTVAEQFNAVLRMR